MIMASIFFQDSNWIAHRTEIRILGPLPIHTCISIVSTVTTLRKCFQSSYVALSEWWKTVIWRRYTGKFRSSIRFWLVKITIVPISSHDERSQFRYAKIWHLVVIWTNVVDELTVNLLSYYNRCCIKFRMR